MQADATGKNGIWAAIKVPRWVKAVGDIDHNRGGYLYDLIFEGEMIVKGSRSPIYDLCRALLERGYTGTARTIDKDGSGLMRCDIEKGAKLTVGESDEFGPRVRKWYPFDADRVRHVRP